MHGLEGSP
jgi:hypothetical protein